MANSIEIQEIKLTILKALARILNAKYDDVKVIEDGQDSFKADVYPNENTLLISFYFWNLSNGNEGMCGRLNIINKTPPFTFSSLDKKPSGLETGIKLALKDYIKGLSFQYETVKYIKSLLGESL